MKRFVTILTTIIATAAIALAIMPTTFADSNIAFNDYLKENGYIKTGVGAENCSAKSTYENGTIVTTFKEISGTGKLENEIVHKKNRNEPAMVGTPVKFILPDGTIYYDRVNERGDYGFYHNKAKAGDFADGYDENGNATMLSKVIARDVNDALQSNEPYTQYTENETDWAIFKKLMKGRIERWEYMSWVGPGTDPYYRNRGPEHIDAILEGAKGTRYESLIVEWVNKVRAARNGEPVADTTPVTPIANTNKFTDVAATHWANANIEKVAEIGAFNGYEDGTFRPDNQITHEEFLKVIMAIIYDDDVTAAPKATVTWADWAQPYLNAAFETGIVTAADTDLVATGTPITRAEMAKIIARALDYLGKQVNATDNVAAEVADWNNIPDAYKPYIAQAYTAGILAGYEDNTFKADKSLTRAETAAVVMRIAD